MARRATKKISHVATIVGGMRLSVSADEDTPLAPRGQRAPSPRAEAMGAKSAHEASPHKLAMALHGSESDEEIPLHEAASAVRRAAHAVAPPLTAINAWQPAPPRPDLSARASAPPRLVPKGKISRVDPDFGST